jgi:hypothetical protein
MSGGQTIGDGSVQSRERDCVIGGCGLKAESQLTWPARLPCPLAGQALEDGGTDAAAATGHQRALILQ